MDISSRHGVYETLVKNKFSKKLIISVSGVGDIEKNEIPFESQSSIEAGVPDVSSIFVRDISRSWYTNEHGFDGLIEFLRSFIEHQQITDVTIYGVSMGACGALLISKYINANRAIAISPRTLLGESCTFDRRILDLSSKVKSPRHPDLAKIDFRSTQVTIIASIDTPEDAVHASRMVATNAKVLGARGDHNVAHTMRLKGLLSELIKSSVDGLIIPEKFGFFELSADFATSVTMHVVDHIGLDSIPNLHNIPDNQIPQYMLRFLYKKWIYNYLNSPQDSNFEKLHAYPAHIGQVLEGPSLTPYLASGWSSPEDFGIWGIGHYHSIRFDLVDYNLGDQILIAAYGRVFTHSSIPPIELVGYVNGRKCIDAKLSSHTYQFESMVYEPNVQIDFFTANPISPSSAGIGADSRNLSIAITKILIEHRPAA